MHTIQRPSSMLDDCTVCTVTDNTPGHDWWTSDTNFEIYTNDPALIGTQDKVTFTDVEILTNSPTGCAETVPLTIELINPCEDTPTAIETRTIADINIILDDPLGEQDFVVGHFTDTVSLTHGP